MGIHVRRGNKFFPKISSSFDEDNVIDYYQYRSQRGTITREYWRHPYENPYIEKNINCSLFIASE